jgi:hypothetical protein
MQGEWWFIESHLPKPGALGEAIGVERRGRDGACIVTIPSDQGARVARNTLRHERGHCNGWPDQHPRSRADWRLRRVQADEAAEPDGLEL